MCGITGILNLSGGELPDPSLASRMAAQLHHRGPDDEGFYSEGPVAFGFRRLSIIDVAGGHQPISNADGSVWVMLNGEIYNYVELRDSLRHKHTFRTASDTEVVVHAYEEHGLEFVNRLRGMFAIALWDARLHRLVLARDRIGKKPLFYSVANGQLAFSSELKGLLPWPGLDRTIDADAVHDYLSFLYVPAPRSIFKGVSKLLPAHLLVAEAGRASVQTTRYWRVEPRPNYNLSPSEARDGLREILEESVRIRLRSDVPLGSFLSGGIDSSAVTALAAKMPGGQGLKTISMGFDDPRYDESGYALRMSRHLGTDHTRESFRPVGPDEWRKLVWFLDEPFADSSAIPTYLISRAARKQVKAVLSGDGGDELFAGYPRYQYARWLGRLARAPRPLLRTGAGVAGLLKGWLGNSSTRAGTALRRVQKALETATAPPDERILLLLTYFEESTKGRLYSDAFADRVNGYDSLEFVAQRLGEFPAHEDPIVSFMARDLETNLPGDSLVKVDRMSMACSLEVRSPLLDHKLVEFAATLPPEMKLKGRNTKVILKEAVADLLPEEVLHRGKAGFAIPFDQWIATPNWSEMVLDCLSEESVRRRGFFQPAGVLEIRDAVLRAQGPGALGISEHQLWHRFWLLLCLELWCRQFLETPMSSGTTR